MNGSRLEERSISSDEDTEEVFTAVSPSVGLADARYRFSEPSTLHQDRGSVFNQPTVVLPRAPQNHLRGLTWREFRNRSHLPPLVLLRLRSRQVSAAEDNLLLPSTETGSLGMIFSADYTISLMRPLALLLKGGRRLQAQNQSPQR